MKRFALMPSWKRVLQVLLFLLVLVVAGCGGDDDSGGGGGGGSSSSGKNEAGDLTAAVLLPGSRNDQSWNSFGYQGIKTVEKELSAKTAFAENVQDADQENALRTFANQGFKLIFGHTDRFQSSMIDVAPDFSDSTFIAVAGTKGNGSNVSSVDVSRQQFAYLEGYVAGKMTKTNTVGVVSGLEGLPVTVATVGGFRLGVEAANPEAEVRVVYVSDMEDAAAAKQAVGALASSDADVVLPFLNAGMTGAIEGAKDAGIFTFGRGPSNTDLAPKSVLTNVAEDWSSIYLATAKLAVADKLEGSHQTFGYHTESTDGTTGATLVYREGQPLNPAVPESVQKDLTRLQDELASGKLDPQPTKADAQA